MAILPVQQFPILTPDQMSPYGGLLKNALNSFTGLTNAAYFPKEKETALKQAMAEAAIKQATAQYAPQMESAKLATEQSYPAYYGAQTQNALAEANRTNTMTPLEAIKQKILNANLSDREKAEIAEKNAMANMYSQGGRYQNAAQQNMNAFKRQEMLDNPQNPDEDDQSYNNRINQIINAHLSEQEKLENGQKVPEMSGLAQQYYQNVTGKNAPVAIKNQAANLDMLYQDLKGFDIDAIKKFAGPAGKAKLAYAKAQMAINPDDPNIDQDARNFLTAMNQSIYNMDTMRKAFGTSVVPEYVYKTVGRLTNPADSIWNDATQVGQNFNAVIDQVGKNRNLMFKKVRQGVTASIPETNPTDVFNKVKPEGEFSQGAQRLSNNLKLPQFNSKEEFQDWYKKQPKMVQDAVKLNLTKGNK